MAQEIDAPQMGGPAVASGDDRRKSDREIPEGRVCFQTETGEIWRNGKASHK